MAIGRDGAAFCWPAPGTGPGEPRPFGPGLGAVPGFLETAAALVGLGLGTPDFGAGGSEAWAAGPARRLGAELAWTATAAAVGEALGATGAGVAGLAVGAAVGAGGFGEGAAVARAVGAGDGSCGRRRLHRDGDRRDRRNRDRRGRELRRRRRFENVLRRLRRRLNALLRNRLRD